MHFIENGKEGHPALALVAKTRRQIADPAKPGCGGNHNKIRVQAGYVRAIRLIPQADPGGLRQTRRDLLCIVGGQPGKGWRIAEGAAVSTPEEVAAFEAQAVARAAREIEIANLPWYSAEHTTTRRSGYSGFDDAQAICDYINRRVGERAGCTGDEGREALQSEIDTLDPAVVEVYGIHICERQP